MAVIGVLAIQGAVEEHVKLIENIGSKAKEIRVPDDINEVDGIILPGGESTAMAIIGEESGLFRALKTYVKENRPIWGTCAGMILLSDHAIMQRKGGQSLVGGLNAHVCRNFFGSQIASCVLPITMHDSIDIEEEDNHDETKSTCSTSDRSIFTGVFIRAPAILEVGSEVKVLASLSAKPHRSAINEVKTFYANIKKSGDGNRVEVMEERCMKRSRSNDDVVKTDDVAADDDDEDFNVYVAVKQGNILATAFHPELTNDTRWHMYFMKMIKDWKKKDYTTCNS